MGKMYYRNIFNSKRINGSASLGAADPFLIKVNGYYYLTCTRRKGLVLMKSFDLIHWENVNEDGIIGLDETLENAYAPEIIYYDGFFYATASPSGNGHYLYKSENIEGPFKRISENIQELIDGSFFVDSDLEKYFLRASESGIVIKHFKESREETNFTLFDKYHYFKDGIIGNWTEGPYLLKRYGYYYLTFTGTHFLSDGYRVNYASGKDINNETSLTHQELMLISTKDDFYGLGHSMNILAPNLDSYYIAYHNMCLNGIRYLNLSRLMFDKKGHMLVNGLKVENNFKIERPNFEIFSDSENYLSDKEFKDNNFSIEYNFKSKKCELLIGYKDEHNYQSFIFENRYIILRNVENDEVIDKVVCTLTKDINFDNYHTLRIQYKANRLALYLDLIELNDKINIRLNKGKIGFKNNKLKKAYLAYSKYSFGSSDIINIKEDQFYLDTMSKNGNIYSTEIYIKEDGYYDFFIDNNNAEISDIFIDNKDFIKNYKNKNIKMLSSVYLKKGKHQFKIKINKGLIYKFKYILNEQNAKDLNNKNYLDNMYLKGKYLKLKDGIYFENDRNALLTNASYFEYEVNVDLDIIGLPTKQDRLAGLIIDVNNYSASNAFEGVYSFNGYALLLNSKEVYVVESDFHHSKVLKRLKIKTSIKDVNLKIKKYHDCIKFYLNNINIYVLNKPSRFIQGKVGIYMDHASVMFKTFNLINKEEN